MRFFLVLISLLIIANFNLFAEGWNDTLPNGVKAPWGNLPKCVHGDDGGKWLRNYTSESEWEVVRTYLADTPPGWDSNRSIMKPVGDGSWYIKLKYSPGYTINTLKVIYLSAARVSDSMTPTNWWYYDDKFAYTISNITVPSTATVACTYGINWGGTPLALDTGWGHYSYPDSGALTLKWKSTAAKGSSGITGGGYVIDNGQYGDVDTADSSSQYGYKLYRSTSPSGPFTQIGPTFITREYIDPLDNSLISYTDTGLTNGETYYYVVRAIDAYGASSDSSTGNWYGVPANYIDVYFKVEGADPEVIEKNNGIVYLTPYINGEPQFFKKEIGRMIWATPQERL